MDDFFKQGGIDVEEMKMQKDKVNQPKTDQKKDEDDEFASDQEEEYKNVDPDENMTGYLSINVENIGSGENKDTLSNLVGGLEDGLKFGTSQIKEGLNKSIKITQMKDYFALKNGVLYWYPHERARKSKGSIIVKNIKVIKINPKNKLELTIMMETKIYSLQSLDTQYTIEKWFNSLKTVQEMGDLQNLNPNRYAKINVFTRKDGRIVFKDYEILIDLYETKLCGKIVQYKYDKIFISEDQLNANRSKSITKDKKSTDMTEHTDSTNLTVLKKSTKLGGLMNKLKKKDEPQKGSMAQEKETKPKSAKQKMKDLVDQDLIKRY